MFKVALVGTIRIYQRFVSPYKGYTCAHRVYCGGDSCSEFAKYALMNYSTMAALKLIKQRLLDCRAVFMAHSGLRLSVPDGTALSAEENPKKPTKGCGDDVANMCTLPCF
jgi:putative component of membrane protein insertase Oxa1/YidC/SpoIIIJ protein YidD